MSLDQSQQLTMQQWADKQKPVETQPDTPPSPAKHLTSVHATAVREWQVRWLSDQGWTATPDQIRTATQDAINKGLLNNF